MPLTLDALEYDDLMLLADGLEQLIKAIRDGLDALPNSPAMRSTRVDMDMRIERAELLARRLNEARWG